MGKAAARGETVEICLFLEGFFLKGAPTFFVALGVIGLLMGSRKEAGGADSGARGVGTGAAAATSFEAAGS